MLFLESALFHGGQLDAICDGTAQESEQRSQNHGHQHIGRVVDVQIQPGEGHQHRQNDGGNAHFLAVLQQHHCGLEGGDGVSGGEGEVVLGIDQQIDGDAQFGLEIIGAYPRHQGLQGHIAHQQAHQQGADHGNARLAGLGDDEHNHCPGDPEDAAFTEQGNDGHDGVHQGGLKICLDPVQDGQIKGNCQLVQKCLYCLHGHAPSVAASVAASAVVSADAVVSAICACSPGFWNRAYRVMGFKVVPSGMVTLPSSSGWN